MKKLLYILPFFCCLAFFATSCEDEALIEIEEQQQKEEECTGSYCKLDTGIPTDVIAFLDFSNPSTF